MASPSNIQRFTKVLQGLYKFPCEPAATAWKPPPAPAGHLGRYLWTDAFGVLNFITLYKLTGTPLYLSHATTLATTVHEVLGRTRDQKNCLPGATDANPLGGGLRIGKEDAHGSDPDGQYHHYLTLWMFALNRLAVSSGTKSWNESAISLAKAIHPHFVYNRNTSRPRMYWKMSIDLQQPLVRSEGNLDPIDGYVIYKLLQSTDGPDSTVLEEEIRDYKMIVDSKWRAYSSSDPLDLGMTLWTSHWVADEDWGAALLQKAKSDLYELFEQGHFERNLKRRLAFREFGTALGMKCALDESEKRADELLEMWDTEKDTGRNWESDLMPISTVMNCAALIPGTFKKGFFPDAVNPTT